MGRAPRRTGLARAAALTLAAFAAIAPAAQAGWSKPFEFSRPGTLDLTAPSLAFSPGGAAAVGFANENVDTPGQSQAYIGRRSASGAIGAPRPVGGAQQILALGFDGSALQLLTGASPSGLSCCSSAEALRLTAGGAVHRRQTLVGGLTGATDGRLLTLGHGMLAALATERGVWVVQSDRSDRFGAQHRLSAVGATPESLAATGLGGQDTVVAWTAARGLAGALDPRSIFYSLGTRKSPPRSAHTLLTVPAGHRIDELAVAARGSGATAAWVESWYDGGGRFHSQVRAADVGAHPGVRGLSAPGQTASGLTLAADPAGDQAAVWKVCRDNGSCGVQVSSRGAQATFGATSGLGAIDAGQAPALTVGGRGRTLAGWIRDGHPVATAGSAASRRFGAVRVLSGTTFAYDLALAFGPRRDALAAWTQGTLNPSLVGAAYRG